MIIVLDEVDDVGYGEHSSETGLFAVPEGSGYDACKGWSAIGRSVE